MIACFRVLKFGIGNGILLQLELEFCYEQVVCQLVRIGILECQKVDAFVMNYFVCYKFGYFRHWNLGTLETSATSVGYVYKSYYIYDI